MHRDSDLSEPNAHKYYPYYPIYDERGVEEGALAWPNDENVMNVCSLFHELLHVPINLRNYAYLTKNTLLYVDWQT